MSFSKPIIFSSHAQEKMIDRGASEEEVRLAICAGKPEPARKKRVAFRKNFSFDKKWRGKHYAAKQVVPIVSQGEDKFVVVTVFVYYF